MRLSLKGPELLEIRESPEAVEVISKAPGSCKPVIAVLLSAILSALLPTLLGIPVPTSLRDLGSASLFHVLGTAYAIGGVVFGLQAAHASGRLLVDASGASLREHQLFGYARYECPLSELEVIGVDYNGSDEGGYTLWPMHYLALRFGNRVRAAMYGHSEEALLEVCRRLLSWLQAHQPPA